MRSLLEERKMTDPAVKRTKELRADQRTWVMRAAVWEPKRLRHGAPTRGSMQTTWRS